MSKDLSVNKAKFIFEWVLVNLAGWIIFEFVLNVVSPFIEPDTRKATFFIGITIIGLLLGASIGIMQLLWLNAKKWHIQPFWWIFETTFGWGFSGLLVFFWASIGYSHIYSVVFVVLVGVIIGTLQALVWRKSIRKSILWVAANAFGMLALGLIMYGVLLGPLIFQTTLLITFHSLFVQIPAKVLYLLYFGITLPFLGAIPTSLPTGFLLYSEYRSRNAGMSGEINV